MYFVKYGKEYLHDPRSKGYILLDLTIDCEENSCGYCDFTIYPDHPMYGKLRERDADNPIEVYDDDILLFAGFIYELGKEFYLNGQVRCKGELDYLSESIVRPYSTLRRGYGNLAPYSLNSYFEWLIDQHNKQVSDNKQFKIGHVYLSNLDKSNYIYAENDMYPSTVEEISEKLINVYGGYLQVRHENGSRYIDYIAEWSDENTQVLDFGVNLTDYTETDDSSSLATYVVPMGASMSSTDYDYNDGYFVTSDTSPVKGKEYYTRASRYTECSGLTSFDYGVSYYETQGSTESFVITSDKTPNSSKKYYVRSNIYSICPDDISAFESGATYYEYNEANDESKLLLTLNGYPDNYLNSTKYINKEDLIYSVNGVKKYGWIGKTVQNAAIATKKELYQQGLIELINAESPKRTIEIKAVDMHFVNPDIKPIKIGEYVRVRSTPHNLDSYFLCREISLDLNNPENSTYILGSTYDTLTGEQNKRAKELNSKLNKQYDSAYAISKEAKESAIKAIAFATEVKQYAMGVSESASGYAMNRSAYELGEDTILWSGDGYYMDSSQTINFSQPLSYQLNGAIFCWCYCVNGVVQNDNWLYFFVPKTHVLDHDGSSVCMDAPYSGMKKSIYISDEEAVGIDTNAASGTTNGIAWNNTNYVLKYVIGV